MDEFAKRLAQQRAPQKAALGLPERPDPLRHHLPDERAHMERLYAEDPAPFRSPYERIGSRVRDYFEPTSDVRMRDGAREIPGAVRGIFGGLRGVAGRIGSKIGGDQGQLGTLGTYKYQRRQLGEPTSIQREPMKPIEFDKKHIEKLPK